MPQNPDDDDFNASTASTVVLPPQDDRILRGMFARLNELLNQVTVHVRDTCYHAESIVAQTSNDRAENIRKANLIKDVMSKPQMTLERIVRDQSNKISLLNSELKNKDIEIAQLKNTIATHVRDLEGIRRGLGINSP